MDCLDQPPAPDGQGFAITFRKGDDVLRRCEIYSRNQSRLLVQELATLDFARLLDEALKIAMFVIRRAMLRGQRNIAKKYAAIYVGKRSGAHSVDQSDISQSLNTHDKVKELCALKAAIRAHLVGLQRRSKSLMNSVCVFFWLELARECRDD